eukprot:scpid92286/ scgid5157/ 
MHVRACGVFFQEGKSHCNVQVPCQLFLIETCSDVIEAGRGPVHLAPGLQGCSWKFFEQPFACIHHCPTFIITTIVSQLASSFLPVRSSRTDHRHPDLVA